MKLDYKGIINRKSTINELVIFLKAFADNQFWEYMGLTIVIDPTVDFNEQNVLVRWLDIEEGFNDKIIVNSLNEFNNSFKPVN